MTWFFKIIIVLASILHISVTQGAFFSTEDFDVALGVQGNSLLYKRGIITYEGYQIVPIYTVQLFNPKLFMAGGALYYKHELSKNLLLRTRLNFDSTLDKPLYKTLEDESARPRRESTTELDIYLEYTVINDSFFRFLISQDVIAHKGNYFELRGRLALLDLYKKNLEKPLIQLGIFSSIGYGSSQHNDYFYGKGANKAGFNNLEYGISITSPKVIEKFWPTFKITRFHVLGSNNKEGSHIQETKGWSIEALMAFQVW